MSETREQAAAWVDENAPRIYIREYVDGQWQSIALSELPDPERRKWRETFIQRRLQGVPVYRVVPPTEETEEGGAGSRVEHIWAILGIHGSDQEHVLAVQHDGSWTSLVTADKANLAKIVAIARRMGKESNVVVTLARFDVRTDVETYYPDGRRERPSQDG